jgi:hypothetical protein
MHTYMCPVVRCRHNIALHCIVHMTRSNFRLERFGRDMSKVADFGLVKNRFFIHATILSSILYSYSQRVGEQCNASQYKYPSRQPNYKSRPA